MKKYMVVSVQHEPNGPSLLVPVSELFTRFAAEQYVAKAAELDPESHFMIQEVGNA
jgi:hypothetical protein